ncbi:hypothetical protein TeGR_g10632 [Tetraparma gracilis]|uniref:Uncharacterized protein n=1 Tax=Tetraparma gracilis TaxID=2962635 RepID=A0ABQ6MRH1_9STRA|nr:hypothetical protein TeGR_g10632 [Tetraparma gracilis]
MFNLQNAFGLQLARVDAEWGVYEQQMVNDYEAQKAAIMGKRRKSSASYGAAQSSGPWKSKEKQALLFNTAPVFSPDGGLGGGSESSRRKMQALDAELANLDKLFAAARDKIDLQKKNAVQWIKRQEARMKIQLDGVVSDRKVMVGFMERANQEYDRFLDQIVDIAEAGDDAAVGAGASTPPAKAKLVGSGGGGAPDNSLFDDGMVTSLANKMRMAGTGADQRQQVRLRN